MNTIYMQLVWQLAKLSVNTLRYIWIAVVATASFATLTGQQVIVPLVTGILNLCVLTLVEACINLIEKNKEAENDSSQ